MGDRDVVAEAINGLSRKIDGVMPRKWTVKDTVQTIILAALVAWNIACQSRYASELAIMQATILDLRRIIAMQREDPKAFPRLKKQFEEIENYESGNGGSGRDVR